MERTNTSPELLLAADDILRLGSVVVAFADVQRMPRLPDNRRENDVEHSYHLSVTAIELANRFYPDLDVGLVAQFSLVHDLPERYAGDVSTFRITPEQRAIKEANEAVATERILQDLPPYLAGLLKRYELQQETEARLVRLIDKLLPAVITMQSSPEHSLFLADYEITAVDDLKIQHREETNRLQERFPEFPEILQLAKDLSLRRMRHFFPTA